MITPNNKMTPITVPPYLTQCSGLQHVLYGELSSLGIGPKSNADVRKLNPKQERHSIGMIVFIVAVDTPITTS